MILVKKVLNSSVVLVEEDGVEKIVLGKGLGFGKKTGDTIDDEHIDKIYLEKNTKTSYITDLMEEIPFEFFEITRDITHLAETILGKKLDNTIYLTLTDHIHFAIERARKGQCLPNKLYWEIRNYYPNEFNIGEESRQKLNEMYDLKLPEEEASNIAFHIINAQSQVDENNNAFNYAKMIGAIVNIVKYSIESPIDTSSIHYTRFITHVRFFVERYYSNLLLHDENNELYQQMWHLYPNSMSIADKVKQYIKKYTTIPYQTMKSFI